MSSSEPESRHADGSVEHPDVPYEKKDIRFGCILAVIIATACIFALVFTLDWYFFRQEEWRQGEIKRSPYTRSSAETSFLPPSPRLEQVDRMESKIKSEENKAEDNYDERLAEMVRQLHGSGPTAEKGFVHIPIEQAIKK